MSSPDPQREAPEPAKPDHRPGKELPDVRDPAPQVVPEYPPGDQPGGGGHIPTSPPPMG